MSQPTDIVSALVNDGVITSEQAARASADATRNGTTALAELILAKAVDRVTTLRVGAKLFGLDFVDLAPLTPNPSAVALLSGKDARNYNVVPLQFDDDDTLVIAAEHKTAVNIQVADDLTRVTDRSIRFVVATRDDIASKLAQIYRAEDEFDELGDDQLAADDLGDPTITSTADDAPIVRFVNGVLGQAILDRASDIHFEPGDRQLTVRYRIDGVLKLITEQHKGYTAAIISRLKIMAGMDITEKRLPQDGRITVRSGERKVDLRVSSLPSVWGEKIVLRILDNSARSLDLRDLGFRDSTRTKFESSYKRPYGMILVTGPTGSGKSTTLYGALNEIANDTVNVITIEDPVEYRISGITQVQVNAKAGLTFERALPSILRADPDIVLVGEIRDHATAKIAVEAALTGHLVLSTLHTNDAPSALVRLIEMDIEPFLVGSAIDVVLAQRLCRVLCDACKQPYTPSEDELTSVGFPWVPGQPLPTLMRATGCANCSNTGFYGRTALHEVMKITPTIERLAVARSSAEVLRAAALEEGMEDLRTDGWAKVLAGVTTIEEVLRVVI